LFEACGIRDISFQDGEKPLATAFKEGRRFAGLLIAGAVQAQPVKVSTRRKPIREAKADD
jgi:hypothetical protein